MNLEAFKGKLPYASELFGVYQPLLGWKSKIIQRRLGNRVMGFGAVEHGRRVAEFERDAILHHVEPEDLITYGFIPEFIGRLPMVSVLEQLT